MGKEADNSHELRNFVEKHNLRNNHSIIHFEATVSITTSKNKITNFKSEVMITFDDYGRVMLLRSEIELDPKLYPTEFNARWQLMEHVDGEYLFISDIHRNNANIGKYSAKINPLTRIND